jgi:oxygen-dependent protoporphyrinogen oxidase
MLAMLARASPAPVLRLGARLVRAASSSSSASSSSASAAPRPPPRTLAVAGGGIAGLTAALLLARALPARRILLLERSARTGGWVHSERRVLEGGAGDKGATALLESGPRSIRPTGAPGLAMLELVSWYAG